MEWVRTAPELVAHSPQFAQRLMTVTSRVLGPAEHRGSDDMLYHLIRDVDQQAAGRRAARSLPLRTALRPWLLVALLIAAAWGLTRVPGLELPRLALRFAAPILDVPPVTTTRLAVAPGDASVVQGKPLELVVRARNLPSDGDGVTIIYTKDGQNWSQAAMLPDDDDAGGDHAGPAGLPTPTSDADRSRRGGTAGGTVGGGGEDGEGGDRGGRFTFTLGAIDRDVRYYVTAGDATTRHYRVKVLRTPSVSYFVVRYTYPAHALRPPLTVTNTDGLIEAPAGTEALVTIAATEPLQSAQLRVGGQRVLMSRVAGEGDQVRQARVRVEKDLPYELDLISAREVAGGGPPTARVRAVPDAAPLVRLLQPADSLRLNPREIVPLTYEALDDYGIDALAISVQPNSGAATVVPLPVRGDPRRQEDTYDLDLATMKLRVGDIVTVTVTARDRSQKAGDSEPLQILVSPRSVDVDTHVRVSELNAAADMAVVVEDELEQAAAAMEEAEREKSGNATLAIAAGARANRHLSSAAELAALVRQSLLRAAVRGDTPELSTAIATWVDAYQLTSSLTEAIFRQKGMSSLAAPARGGGDDQVRDLLRRLLDGSRKSRDELKTVSQGEQAAALLADRENLRASEQGRDDADHRSDANDDDDDRDDGHKGKDGGKERGRSKDRDEPKDKRDGKDRGAAGRRRETLQRARAEIAEGVKRLGLAPKDGGLDDRLRERVGAAEGLVKSKRPVNFVEAVVAAAPGRRVARRCSTSG